MSDDFNNYFTEDDFRTGALAKVLNANHIYRKDQIEKYTKFSRFGYFDPYDANTQTREYIFFTKPDLHLYDGTKLNPELASETFFQTANKNFPRSMHQLQDSVSNNLDNGNPFCTILTNTVSSKLSLDDIAMEDIESASNDAGTKLVYPLGTTKSNNIVDFSLEFTDTKYLDVYMFFRIWYQYELTKASGTITPPKDDYYIINKIAHNLSSCYKIVVGEDGETIIYWAKFWGVYPTSIPRSAFSEISTDKITIPVSFKAQWVDDMDAAILTDFNKIVENKIQSIGGSDISIYDNSISAVNGQWCNCPYITSHLQSDDRHVFKLKWR